MVHAQLLRAGAVSAELADTLARLALDTGDTSLLDAVAASSATPPGRLAELTDHPEVGSTAARNPACPSEAVVTFAERAGEPSGLWQLAPRAEHDPALARALLGQAIRHKDGQLRSTVLTAPWLGEHPAAVDLVAVVVRPLIGKLEPTEDRGTETHREAVRAARAVLAGPHGMTLISRLLQLPLCDEWADALVAHWPETRTEDDALAARAVWLEQCVFTPLEAARGSVFPEELSPRLYYLDREFRLDERDRITAALRTIDVSDSGRRDWLRSAYLKSDLADAADELTAALATTDLDVITRTVDRAETLTRTQFATVARNPAVDSQVLAAAAGKICDRRWFAEMLTDGTLDWDTLDPEMRAGLLASAPWAVINLELPVAAAELTIACGAVDAAGKAALRPGHLREVVLADPSLLAAVPARQVSWLTSDSGTSTAEREQVTAVIALLADAVAALPATTFAHQLLAELLTDGQMPLGDALAAAAACAGSR